MPDAATTGFDLTLLAPAPPGSRVGVIGSAPALVGDLMRCAAAVVPLQATSEVVVASLDQLWALTLDGRDIEAVARSGRTWLVPGGTFVLGVRQRDVPLHAIRRTLAAAGYEDVRAYGVMEALPAPGAVVSLRRSGPTQLLLSNVLPVHSRRDALRRRLVPLVALARRLDRAFPHLLVIGLRAS